MRDFGLQAQVALTHSTDLLNQTLHLPLQVIALALRLPEQRDDAIEHVVERGSTHRNFIVSGDACPRARIPLLNASGQPRQLTQWLGDGAIHQIAQDNDDSSRDDQREHGPDREGTGLSGVHAMSEECMRVEQTREQDQTIWNEHRQEKGQEEAAKDGHVGKYSEPHTYRSFASVSNCLGERALAASRRVIALLANLSTL